MPKSSARHSATRKILTFFTLIVFISTIMSPFAALATDPSPPPSTEESASPSSDPTPEPPVEATPEPTAEPTVEPDPTEPPSAPPAVDASVWTGKDDYVPMEWVDMYGAGWLPGETVNLFINDDEGQTWSHSGAVTADLQGEFFYEIQLPSWFVATYTIRATGAASGLRTTTFADSIARPNAPSTNSNSGANGQGSAELVLSAQASSVGDVLVAHVVAAKDFLAGQVICTPIGWTSILRTNRSAVGGAIIEETFYRVATAANASAVSYTFQFRQTLAGCGSNANADRRDGTGGTGAVIRYTGVDTSGLTPIRGSAGATGASATTATAPAVAGAVTGDQVLRFFGAQKSPLTMTPATAVRMYSVGSSNTQERTAGGFETTQAADGSTGTFVATFSTSAEWVSQTVVLKMAAPADSTAPTVTIDQAGGQDDPTNDSPINFTVVFSESVADFATGDVTLAGTAGATTAAVSGSGTTYNVAVSGMTSDGTVIATIAAGAANDAAGNDSLASTSTDNTVTYDTTRPTVTINQAGGQNDPTNASPINFTVVFSESVSNFATGDVTLAGTAGATTAAVTGSGTTYNVAVSGMTSDGTVSATLLAAVATDAAGNNNFASTSTDNTVTYDATAPVITDLGPTTTPNGNGWYNTDVVNRFQAVDALTGLNAACAAAFSEAASTQSRTTSGEGLAVTVSSDSCTDNAGNTAAALSSAAFQIDTTAPHSIVGTPDRAPNGAGWYNAPVDVTFSGTDDLSGIDSCSNATYSGPDSATASQAGSCTDRAGNTGNGAFGLKYDDTAPTVTIGLSPEDPDGANGWYVSDVTVSLTANDDTSGVDAASLEYRLDGGAWTVYTGSFVVSADGSHTVDARVEDNADNTDAAPQATFKIDKSNPGISLFSRVPAENLNGWNNTDVTLTWECTDLGSGVVSQFVSNIESTEGEDYDSTQTCTDNAGNTASDTQQVSIDTTAPHSIVGTPDRASNGAGWYNAPVDVEFDGVDDLSGIDSCSNATYSGPDSATASQAGSCTDLAGNTGNGAFGLKYDETAPTVTIGLSPAAPNGANGWYVSNVTVSLTANDDTSGVDAASLEYRLNGGAWTLYTGSFVVSADSAGHTVDARVEDNADNTDAAPQATFKIDKTAPSITDLGPTTEPNGADWYNSDVVNRFQASDATSGLSASCLAAFNGASDTQSKTTSGEGLAVTVDSDSCTDAAGNMASALSSDAFQIDKTAPVITYDGQTPVANANGWNNTNVTLDWSCTDNLSNFAPGGDVDSETLTNDGANQSATGSCTDLADNSASDLQTGIDIDKTAPVITYDGQTPVANANGWNNTNVTLDWSCTDNLSNFAPGGDVDSETLTNEGANQSATGSCTDLADNSASDLQTGIDIDKTAPHSIGGTPDRAANAAGWYNAPVDVTFSGVDDLSGIDTCTTATYSGPDSDTASQPGSCTDLAGNTGNGAFDLKYDQTDPTITFASRLPGPNGFGWNNADVTVTWTCSDATSGPVDPTVSDTVSSEGAGQFANANCEDEAGNTSSTASEGDINIDKTAPTITDLGPTTSPNGAGWYNHDVTNEFQAADTLSGLHPLCAAAFPAAGNVQSKTTTGEGVDLQVTSDSCADKAGNTAGAVTSTEFDVDQTPPTIDDLGPTTSPNGAGWYNHDVTNEFQAADGLSGLNAACLAAFADAGNTQSKTTTGEGTAVHVASDSCTDVADNTAAAIDSDDFKVDKTDPSVDITSPANGSSTIALTTPVSGTSSDSLSGVASVNVNGTPATYAAGSWFGNVPLSCGPNLITAMSVDVAGNSETDSITVTRICFSNLQYYQPLDQTQATASQPTVNVGKFGRVIPTKVTFKLDDGTVVTEAEAAARGWTIQIGVNGASCTSGAASDTVEAYADAGQSNAGTNMFRWTTSQWIYNLDTGRAPQVQMVINQCYRLDVYVSDGVNKTKVSTATYAIFKPTK